MLGDVTDRVGGGIQAMGFLVELHRAAGIAELTLVVGLEHLDPGNMYRITGAEAAELGHRRTHRLEIAERRLDRRALVENRGRVRGEWTGPVERCDRIGEAPCRALRVREREPAPCVPGMPFDQASALGLR